MMLKTPLIINSRRLLIIRYHRTEQDEIIDCSWRLIGDEIIALNASVTI